MSPRGLTRERPTKRPLIVLAGEDSNDRKVFRTLLEAVCPDAQGRIVEINSIIRLRDAKDATLVDRAGKLAGAIRARATREQAEVACVFIHEDFDATDSPKRDAIRARVNSALRREIANSHYILAAWEIEAWMLLFPDAVSAVNATWVIPNRFRGMDTGRITDPKRAMQHEVSTVPRSRYRESDAPKIFEKIIELGLYDSPSGSNRSYCELRQSASDCCAAL